MARVWFLLGSAAAFTLVSFLACSPVPSPGGGTSSGAMAGSSGVTGGSGGAGAVAGDGGAGGLAEGGSSGTGAFGGCTGTAFKATPVPLDIFVMLDQSGSMLQDAGNGQNKWQAVKKALTSFMMEKAAAGIGLGIQYFGLPDPNVAGCPAIPCSQEGDCTAVNPGCTTCGPGGVCHSAYNPDIDACDPVEYAWAEVPIAPLPGNGNAILASLGMHAPGTNTPTAPALQGAIDYARAWKTAHAGHVAVVALATDGLPSECDMDQSHLNDIAAKGLSGMPSIPTYVIGVGPALSELDAIASAGGTKVAFHVDLDPNVEQAFLDAMNTIRGAALGCKYQIPPPPQGKALDFDLVNVDYTPGGGGMKTTIPKVDSPAQCPASGDAWYYDDSASPTAIVLCDATCGVVSKDVMGGEVDIVLGCETIVK
jgi:hypothetical protein